MTQWPIAVDVALLEDAARVLGAHSEDLRAAVRSFATSPGASSPGAVATAALWRAWWDAEAESAAAVLGTVRTIARLTDLEVALRLAAALYAAREEALRRALRALADAAAYGGLLTEEGSRIRVRPVAPDDDRRWRLGSAGSALAMVSALSMRSRREGRVRVVGVACGDGSVAWTVLIPGTQSWDPVAGDQPFDVTTDVQALAGRWTLLAAGVAEALRAAQASRGRAGAGDRVLLVGHSQGGIIAASLASDPAFRTAQRVTHVVTAGAPVSGFEVPAEVSVLAVEHEGDPVPQLDLLHDPIRPGWVTIRSPPVLASPHDADGYAAAAHVIDAAPPGSVAAHWREGAEGFFAGPVLYASDFLLDREVEDSPVAESPG